MEMENNIKDLTSVKNLSLEEIDNLVITLLTRRCELVYEQMGAEDRYFVFNNKTNSIAEDAWVLSSRSVTDRRVLEDISSKDIYPEEWNKEIKSWLVNEEVTRVTDYSEVEDI